jgi:hypothetical protein
VLFSVNSGNDDLLYRSNKGEVTFVSEAPLELIKAKSVKLKGLVNPKQNTFAFTVPILSFDGFNSTLQKEHFHENYMETSRYPNAIFKGKIIEGIDFASPGKHNIRAKGIFSMHGVEREKIIRCSVEIDEKDVVVHSEFELLIEDYNIKIPKIVNQKIASVIKVSIDVSLIEN